MEIKTCEEYVLAELEKAQAFVKAKEYALNENERDLRTAKMNFLKTKVLLEFNTSFLNDDPIIKMIELILKIDVEKDTEMIAEILLNNGKENLIYNEVK